MRKHLLLLLCSLLVAWNLHAQSVGYQDNWPKPNGTIRAIVRIGNTVYIGGLFNRIGGQSRIGLAAIDAATGTLTSWNPDAHGSLPGTDGSVYALAVSGSTVYAGGDFTTIGGQTRRRIAALDASTGNATSWNPGANNYVFALAVSGSTVYAGGDFGSISGQSRRYIAAIDATTGTLTTWNPNADGIVHALAVSGSTVYAGGRFNAIGGQSRNYIAAIDASTGLATGWDPSANHAVRTLAVSGSTVYAGGDFGSMGGQSRNYIAAIDATTGTPTSWNPNAGGTVYALAVSGSTVYAGGDFQTIGGQSRNYIAALDANSNSATSWNPNADLYVLALAVSGSTVYAGGSFSSMGGDATRHEFMPLDSNYVPATVAIAASANPVCAGASVTFTATPTNASSPTYQWTKNSTAISGATAATYTSTTLANSDTIRCQMTSRGTTATSNAVTMTVNTPTATITAGGPTTFCAGNSVTLTASAGASYLWSNGATTRAITATAAGNYSVTVTNASGCSATSAATAVTVNALPTATVTAGGPTTFCAGNSVTLTASAGASYLWSNGATTQAINATVSGNYSVTVTGANGCSATSAATAVMVNALPTATVTAGGPTTFCAGNSVTLTASAGASYLWSNGATTQAINATASGNYSVTVTGANGCSATSTTTAVTVHALPSVSITAGGPTTFCAGNSVTLTASASASYLWSNGATTQSITATASGNYSVTVTNANGCSATSAATAVTVNPLPDATVTASGPTTFCAGDSVMLSASTAAAYPTYLWSNGETTEFITAMGSGNYSVTITDGNNGCSATSTATAVTVNTLPDATVTASGPTSICMGDSVVLSVPAGASYQWYKFDSNYIIDYSFDFPTTPSVTVTGSGIYLVTINDTNGCSAFSLATVTVNSLPNATVTANGPTTFCNDASVVLIAPASTSYLWSNGATTQAITANTSGSYSVTVTNASGCSATLAATSVTVNPLPVASISSVQNPFCAGTTVVLNASPSGTGYAYSWKLGSTTLSATTSQLNANAAGSYTVAVTDTNGCVGTSAALALTTKTPPSAFNLTAGGVTTFCAGGSVTLSPNIPASTAAAYSTYQWSNNGVAITGATSVSYRATASGNYTIALSDNAGCGKTSVARAVTVNPLPVPSISTPLNPFCVGSSAVLSASPSGGGNAYRWTMGTTVLSSTTAQQTTTAAGSYQVRVTDPNGCVGTSPAFALTTKTPPAVFNLTAGGATTFCAGGTVTLSPNPSANLSGFSNYQWSNNGVALSGATALSYPATASGSYTIAVSDSNGCGRSSTARAVVVNANPVPSISTPLNPFCAGSSAVLNASPSGNGNAYRWTMGSTVLSSTTAQHSTTTVGSYQVKVTDANGCVGTSPAFVLTTKTPPAVFNLTAGGATTFCAGGTVTLSPNPSANLSGFSNYQWSNNGVAITGATALSYPATVTGNYTIAVSDNNGCGRTSVARAVTVNPAPTANITPLGSTTIGARGSVTLQADSATGYTYQWYKNNGVVSGATGRNYTATSGGSYTVRVTSGGCTQTSSALVVTQAAAKESLGVTSGGSDALLGQYFSFSAFPNPAGDKVIVRTNGAVSQSATVQVMTLTGAAVKEVEMRDAQTEIDLSGLATGVYLLRYKDAEGRTGIIRLVKQ